MPFVGGCACHVWAMDGWRNDARSAAVNNAYTAQANNYLMNGTALGDKGARVAAFVDNCRQELTVPNKLARIYGGWQNNNDSAPEHMWLFYNGYYYDTFPPALLRRKKKRFLERRYLHPPSETHAFANSLVGYCIRPLTVTQDIIISTANWDDDDEYDPPDAT